MQGYDWNMREALERCLLEMERSFANQARLTHSESGMNAFAGAMSKARKALGKEE